jgi:hypothetical protein
MMGTNPKSPNGSVRNHFRVAITWIAVRITSSIKKLPILRAAIRNWKSGIEACGDVVANLATMSGVGKKERLKDVKPTSVVISAR